MININSKIIKEYQNLERINGELSKENEINKKAVENAICRLKPPVKASTSMISPAKYRLS